MQTPAEIYNCTKVNEFWLNLIETLWVINSRTEVVVKLRWNDRVKLRLIPLSHIVYT